ncbi:hypothetical protein GCM10011390_42930 [Aureimonas endophytica]|uniref:Lipoprotein n=1 Tax=Aureimonas endophytica TaxID=2027858 RepID=A0A917EBP6_9HYPH|nr:hypothetical protein [Aureimonas endophytica]GGE19153.1 hypothetical protein GCM10011390_42930 [Aureimonas endophytica]
MRQRTVLRAAPLVLLALAACRSVDPGLGIGTPEPAPAAPAAAAPSAAGAEPIQFLPVVGMPADKAALLSEALAKSAAAARIPILGSEAGPAAHRLKGYLSAVRDEQGTLVIYVWDVVDPAGERLNRIQGQVRATGAAGADPWTAVDAVTLRDIADRTLAALRAPAMVADGVAN